MDDEEDKGRNNMEKKKILAILPSQQEIQGDIYNVKIYSSDREGVDWLYSGLEGNFCLVVDFQIKTKYIMQFDPTNYEKVFQYELYNGFNNYFDELAPDFRCFEIDSGFIGLQFDSQADAQSFKRTLDRIVNMKNIYTKSKAKENTKTQNDIFQSYCKKLKDNFSEGDSKYDEKYAEDGTHIFNHRNFKVLSNISYDNKNKKFKFGKISEELKDMFLSYGIKKKDLESDVDFAFDLLKKVIVGLGSENKLKNSALDKIEHTFLPPDEREKARRQEEAAEAKLNIKRTQKKRVAPKNNKRGPPPKSIAALKRGSVPLNLSKKFGPPPPPPPPPPPGTVPTVPQVKETATPTPTPNAGKRASLPTIDRAAELRAIKLKKVEEKPAENKDKNIQGNGKNFLQNALSTALINRREALRMHDEEDDDEEDDWDQTSH